jgi:uncharacterized protein (DUF1501 family)
MTLWEAGELAVVQGAGYPQPNRSHFESMDIWHAADQRGRRMGYGWIGRLADAAFGGSEDPNLVVHIGNRLPFSLHSAGHPAVAFSTPAAYKWVGAREDALALEAAAPVCEHEKDPGVAPPALTLGRDRALSRLRRILHEAQHSSEAVRRCTADYRPQAKYAADGLSASLATVAALITGGLSTRIYSVETGGFDTHVNQRGSHDNLMGRLSEGLSAFLTDLKVQGCTDRVCLMAFSEFGRRVQENGSGGTDHGVAGPMFVLGLKVKGGLHGRHPSLTELEKGDLVHTVDFRQVYATLIDRWMGADHREVLGATFEPVPFL